MEQVIALLREKNNCLEKFYFINEHELINFGEGCFDNVESFYQARDQILDMIRCIDDLISGENEKLNGVPVHADHRTEVEILLRTKDEIVTSILAQDLQVLSYIEKEKSNIIRELRETRRARAAVNAYGRSERLRELDEKP